MLVPLTVAGAVSFFHNEPSTAVGMRRASSMAWPTTAQPPSRANPIQATPSAAAPVGELVSGLEARLAQNPADAKGWALLAQSHAFLGNSAAAEAAIARAVALGLDEAALRGRVELARGAPVDSTLRAD